MVGTVPDKPKIYHIVHIDRLASILNSGGLWSDAKVRKKQVDGTTIGIAGIKKMRLKERKISMYPDLYVGDCVPFYFCPRSEMLYIFHRDNHPQLTYHGGQKPIIHLEAKVKKVVKHANKIEKKWAFTLTNAASRYCEFRTDIDQLEQINWNAVQASSWQDCSDDKQAEFLLEDFFPWELITKIGVYSQTQYNMVHKILTKSTATHKPKLEIKPKWYY